MVTFDIHTLKADTYFTLVFRKINIYIEREVTGEVGHFVQNIHL